MADTWWDPLLYRGSAEHYLRGRMPYPVEVRDALRDELGLDGTGRLLDVGCGPGSLTLLLAPLFAAAVGVDADPEMIAVARESLPQDGSGAVEFVRLAAEDVSARLGAFRVVVLAQSFHWLDRERVAPLLRSVLEPDGTLVHVQATTHRGEDGAGELEHPRPPWDAIETLVRAYLGEQRRAGSRTLPDGTPSGEAAVLTAAGFAGPRSVPVPRHGPVTRTADQVVSSVLSLSSSTPHLLGDRLGAFEGDLRLVLRATSPTALFSEQPRAVVLDLWRTAGEKSGRNLP